MDANDEKINTVEQFGQKLVGQNHYASDKISRKTESLQERYVRVVISLFLFENPYLVLVINLNCIYVSSFMFLNLFCYLTFYFILDASDL